MKLGVLALPGKRGRERGPEAMWTLALGLALFVAPHSVRWVAPGFREAAIGRIGEGSWKGLYALVSLGGLMLVGRGWGEAERTLLYGPVPGATTLLLVLMPLLLIALVAGNLPAGRIRRALRHPMMAATFLWALLHLAVNGDAAAVLLFGVLAAWSGLTLQALLRRERAAALGPHGAMPPAEGVPLPWWPDIAAVAVGVALYVWLVLQGHAWLFGVSPVG